MSPNKPCANDYAQGGWRLSVRDGEWQWQDFDRAFGTDRAVSGPNDKDYTHIYWNNLKFKHGQTQSLNGGDRTLFYFYPSIGKHFARRRQIGRASCRERV